ncbi:alpha/beta hydrolase [Streptomyces sp. OF3]|uniref:Alpha/beta hydrolase n=1 Tax=Streptomyces alkaliterrae TaxID=2213162 RepID=A0A7W3ZLD0_9ACTN|nr:alpha/beta fold hydrolase [Streptomyces alkaliterrae]MBB1252281.1 alpha/beta hydrolase [Streptomyces alkaliterrae]
MPQHALPVRSARLGRPIGARGPVHGVVLVLPGGGGPHSSRPLSRLSLLRADALARRLVGGEEAGELLVAHVVRYRFRGWNGEEASPVTDAAWAADEVVRRYGDIPVCLAGFDSGARAALRAAGHPAVDSVLALGPRLPEAPEEPVRQLIGRRVLLAHGTDDRDTDPELSFRLAERAKKVNSEVCRFEVHTDRHALRHRRTEVLALAQDFVLGALCDRDFCRPLHDAFAAPPPLGLRMPLAAGFGRGPH